eukprot:jgi/Galph1/5601/GphlegSOOS_G4226.1
MLPDVDLETSASAVSTSRSSLGSFVESTVQIKRPSPSLQLAAAAAVALSSVSVKQQKSPTENASNFGGIVESEPLTPVGATPDIVKAEQKHSFVSFSKSTKEDMTKTVDDKELQLVRSAIEKVISQEESSSESSDDDMDTDFLESQDSVASLSDVTPDNETFQCMSVDSVITCPKFDRTVIILDWDDTLLSSSWLASEGLKVDDLQAIPEPIRKELEELESHVLSLLYECAKHGIVSIVTNAETGWVELSARKFIPRVYDYIERCVRVISARSNFEQDYPDSPAEWKEKAFLLELDRLPVDLQHLNLLVLGDSLNERDAGHAARSFYENSHVKSVKFIERPSIEQLKRQLSLIISSFHYLCDHEGSFDINLIC